MSVFDNFGGPGGGSTQRDYDAQAKRFAGLIKMGAIALGLVIALSSSSTTLRR